MDQFDIGSVMLSLVKNVVFLLSVWGVLAFIITMLVKEPAERKTGTKVAGVTVVLIGFVWFWAVANLGFPAFDQVIDGLLAKSDYAVTQIATATTAMPEQSAPEINIQVDVPEQAPPTVIIQNETAPTSGGVVETPVESVEPEPEEPGSDVSFSDRTEMFDLGSEVNGYFKDGVPYKIHNVESGDTIYNIRTRNNLSEAEILHRNPDLDIRRQIIIGQKIKIPVQ